MKIPSVHILIFFLAGFSGYLQAQEPVSDSIFYSKNRKVASVQNGIASFYHDKFEGRPTANGELFTQKKLTAASNSYPLNCWVRVTNLSNDQSVTVRITDRMHARNKRLIDLSRAAASRLKFTGRGLTRVRVEYLGRKKPPENKEVKSNK